MTVARSLLLFGLGAVAEIGGAYLMWLGVRKDHGLVVAALGVLALGAYGLLQSLQVDPNFGRVFAAYGGVFIAGSITWGMIFEGFRPDRWDVLGAAIALVGMAVIMFGPRGS